MCVCVYICKYIISIQTHTFFLVFFLFPNVKSICIFLKVEKDKEVNGTWTKRNGLIHRERPAGRESPQQVRPIAHC